MTTTEKKQEKALEGAYAEGQTDLEGGMVIMTEENIVIKEEAPWAKQVMNVTE